MTIDQFITISKKYGGTGVLAIWLFVTNLKVNNLETLLYDCYQRQSSLDVNPLKNNNQLLAILPKKLDIKKRLYVD